METTTLAPAAVRRLPPEEWDKLAGLPISQGYGLPDPRAAEILVAETPDGQVVGVWALLQTVHLDGLWIAPDYRRHSRVAALLLRGMKGLLTALGIRHSFTIVHHDTPEVLALALKAGFQRMPVDTLLLDLDEEGL